MSPRLYVLNNNKHDIFHDCESDCNACPQSSASAGKLYGRKLIGCVVRDIMSRKYNAKQCKPVWFLYGALCLF